MKITQMHMKTKSLYNKLELESLTVGTVLTFDIYIKRTDNYVIIIEAGTMLSQTLYEKLQRQEKIYISKKNEDRQILSCATLNNYVIYNIKNLETVLSFLYTINNKIFDEYYKSQNDFIDMACLEEIINIIIVLVKKHPKKILKKIIPHFSSEYALANHSLHVAIYSVSLAYFLKLREEQIVQVAKAAIFHDVGIKNLTNVIENKSAHLSFEDMRSVHTHVKHSMDIARKNGISEPHIIQAIMHHHESCDGHGYPSRLEEYDISNLASIISICDVFNALTSERPYRKKYSTFDALKIMMTEENMVHKFRKHYLRVFLEALKQ